MSKLFATKTYRNCVIEAIFTLTSCLISSFAYATCQTVNSTTTVNTSNICPTGNAVEITGGANPSVTISSGTTQSVSGLFTWAVHVNGNVNTLTNNGTITNSASNLTIPLNIESAYTVTSLINVGLISNTQSGGYRSGLRNQGTIGTLTNTGTIIAVDAGHALDNYGTISVLNNSQGAGNASGPLQLSSNLPSQYNIIINSPTQYGQLIGTSAAGSTTFGIYTGSSVSARTYTGVLQGLSPGNLTTTAGTYSGYSWTLVNSAGTTWDLILALLGPSAADTHLSMSLSAQRLNGIYNLQSAAVINGLTYDCRLFDINNICLSTGGRYSNNHAAAGNTTSALLIGAYRIHKNIRLGAWVDQNLSTNTVTGINLSNSKPLFGVFGAWAENPSGEGYEVKVSAGYSDRDLTVTRDVIGTSEAGFGSTRLNTQAISSVSSYGFKLSNDVLASPYVGIQYSRVASNGYTEATAIGTTAPLTYARLAQENISVLAGLKLSAKLDPKTALLGLVGVEQNVNNRSGQYSATGVDGLTSIEFNSNVRKTRATASVGVSYDIDKKQRVSLSGIYREEAFNPTATTSIFAAYTVGL